MLTLLAALAVPVVIGAGISTTVARRAFHRRFEHEAEAARAAIDVTGDVPVGEEDLRELPEPIARWIRWSGAVGKAPVRSLRVQHGGRFRTGPGRPWLPIRGEYLVTTRPPSFHWYGLMRVAPGVSVAAIDSYRAGRGRMTVKALSLVPIADARSPETDQSAFGRCVAELSMTPTFFLDRRAVRCEQAGRDRAICTIHDGRFSTDADVLVHADGSLDRIVVLRRFDRGGGRSTLERFTGKSSQPRPFGGRMLASRLDGIWNLPEGDLHYVAFEIERATFE